MGDSDGDSDCYGGNIPKYQPKVEGGEAEFWWRRGPVMLGIHENIFSPSYFNPKFNRHIFTLAVHLHFNLAMQFKGTFDFFQTKWMMMMIGEGQR